RLVIKEVSLINPEVVWPQNRDGKWRIPSMAPEPLDLALTQAKTVTLPPLEKKAQAPEELPVSDPEPAGQIEMEESAPFTPEIQRVNLVRGRFQFLDEKLKNVATFD